MSFCTSNFKRGAPFLAALATTIALLGATDAALRVYVGRRTNAGTFIDNKDSKFAHLRAQNFSKPLDAIFVGSSLTKNHVSTAEFQSLGWSVYNLGISGRLLGDFPSMAQAALERSPRLVVLDISAGDLVNPPRTDFTHFADLLAVWKAGLPVTELLRSLGNFLLAGHLLHYYREPVYENMAAALKRAAPGPAVAAAPREDRSPAYAEQVGSNPDCTVFKRSTYPNMVVLTCTNGDGIQLGRFDPAFDPVPQLSGHALNENALNMLAEVVREVKGRARPIVVLQPSRETDPPIDLRAVAERIGAPILDLRDATFTPADWCDGGHFNVYGRRKYSDWLEAKLRPFLGGG